MKNLFYIFFAVLLIIPATMVAQTRQNRQWKGIPYMLSSTTVKGDFNNDGDVSISDALMLVDAVLAATTQSVGSNYDMNGDNDISVADILYLVDIILNNGGGIGDTSQAYLTCPDDNHPHIIDLGLPSGTLWACCNVGADKPEGYGNYYAWGETETKARFEWSNYTHCDGSYNTCHYLGSDIAGTQFDVAHFQWGGKWQMPSYEQLYELASYDYTWKKVAVVNNKDVMGALKIGPSGGSIIMPAGGFREGGKLYNIEYYDLMGEYWSSTQDPLDSQSAKIYGVSYFRDEMSSQGRACGLSVRPVWVE